MSVPAFVDTNVLIYADDRFDPLKQQRARHLLDRLLTTGTGRISLQVLQEYFSAATRKLRLESGLARSQVERYAQMTVILLDPLDVLAAIDLHRDHSLSIWDALIVRAAIVSGCRTLYTEDLQHGFRVGDLQVVNPFLEP
jgi:predicted nucleic acid-binding protein